SLLSIFFFLLTLTATSEFYTLSLHDALPIYPVGYFLFWETGVQAGARQIGTDGKQLAPTRVIVDGQQRLTSLYAVLRGVPVIRRSEEHTSELQSPYDLVCRLLLEKKKNKTQQ